MNGFTILLALGVVAAFLVVMRRLAFLEQELRRVESLIPHTAPEPEVPPSLRTEPSVPPRPAADNAPC